MDSGGPIAAGVVVSPTQWHTIIYKQHAAERAKLTKVPRAAATRSGVIKRVH